MYENSRCTTALSITGFVSLFNLAILIHTIMTVMVFICTSLIIEDVGFVFKLFLRVISSLMKHIFKCLALLLGIPSGSAVKNTSAMQELPRDVVQSLGWEDPLEEGMATHCSILAWRIPWTEEPGGPQSMWSWSHLACTHILLLSR